MNQDPETGFPIYENLSEDAVEYAKESVDFGNKISVLSENETFLRLIKFLSDETEKYREKLLFENDHIKILRLQSIILSLRALPEVVKKFELDAKQASAILESLT